MFILQCILQTPKNRNKALKSFLVKEMIIWLVIYNFVLFFSSGCPPLSDWLSSPKLVCPVCASVGHDHVCQRTGCDI